MLMAFGTMEGNLWLKKYAGEFPFKIKSDEVVADKVYKETNLVFITAIPHPQNPDKGGLIFTAQTAEDLVKMQQVEVGATGYTISKNNKTIKAGNYKKKDGKWVF